MSIIYNIYIIFIYAYYIFRDLETGFERVQEEIACITDQRFNKFFFFQQAWKSEPSPRKIHITARFIILTFLNLLVRSFSDMKEVFLETGYRAGWMSAQAYTRLRNYMTTREDRCASELYFFQNVFII